jgi:hypothetical protein
MAKKATPKTEVVAPATPSLDELLGQIDDSKVKSLAASNPSFTCSIEAGKQLANDLMAQHGYVFSQQHVINAGKNGAGELILLAYLVAPADSPAATSSSGHPVSVCSPVGGRKGSTQWRSTRWSRPRRKRLGKPRPSSRLKDTS